MFSSPPPFILKCNLDPIKLCSLHVFQEEGEEGEERGGEVKGRGFVSLPSATPPAKNFFFYKILDFFFLQECL